MLFGKGRSKFFSHHGIDPFSIVRAACKTFLALKRPGGASTITQQVALGFSS